MVTQVAVDALLRVPLFAGFTAEELTQVRKAGELREYQPGEQILTQGEHSQNIWLVRNGTCEVVRSFPHHVPGEAVVLAELSCDDVFGEMSFFEPAPHSAAVRAKTAVTVLKFSRSECDKLLNHGSLVFYKLARNTVATLASRLRKMDARVAELSEPGHTHNPNPEWNDFRAKLFGELRQV